MKCRRCLREVETGQRVVDIVPLVGDLIQVSLFERFTCTPCGGAWVGDRLFVPQSDPHGRMSVTTPVGGSNG